MTQEQIDAVARRVEEQLAERRALEAQCRAAAQRPLPPTDRATAFAGLFASLDDIQRSAEWVRDHAEFLEERLG